MKSSKMENILNYNPPLEDSETISPLTYYQPFQSSFDPEFALPARQNPPQMKGWGSPGAERPIGSLSGGTPWDHDIGGPLPSAPLPSASTSAWGDSKRRSLCNSTWRSPAPGALRPAFPGYEESPGRAALGAPGTYSQFPPKDEAVFRGLSDCRPDSGLANLEGSSFRMGTSPSQVQSFDGSRSTYYPLMLSPLGRNINQNMYKAGHSRPMVCNFCKNNKEVPDIYLNHYLYDPETKVLSCPVLRKHVCEICGGTGDQAHTLQYCPVNRERGLQAKVPVLLKARTITNSTGKIRRN